VQKILEVEMNNIFSEATMIEVNNVRLEVFEAGVWNKGNPIILCHGWPELAFSWRHQIPALVEAGYHVIIPNQRGFGNSSCPNEVTDYDINQLTGDLTGLLDYFGYQDAVFIGHDWGATVVWNLALLHPERVKKIVNYSVPYISRGEVPWVDFLEAIFGPDYYMVHFNRQPGVADKVLDENTYRFIRNLFRKNEPTIEYPKGNLMSNLALSEEVYGEAIMSDEDLAIFVSAFEQTGFTPSINWYRNLDRNWRILESVDPIIQQPALMIYGEKDPVAKAPDLVEYVPKVEVKTLDCGHWIQEEAPLKAIGLVIDWLNEDPVDTH